MFCRSGKPYAEPERAAFRIKASPERSYIPRAYNGPMLICGHNMSKKTYSKLSYVLIVIAITLIGFTVWYVLHVNDTYPVASDSNTKFQKAGTGPRPCLENANDSCVFAPSVDFYPNGIAGNGSNPELRRRSDDTEKQIGGVIVAHSGKKVSLKSTSSTLFYITFPIDAVSQWNAENSTDTHYSIGIGDTLALRYVEPASQHSRTINSDQIEESSLAIKETTANDSIERYSQ